MGRNKIYKFDLEGKLIETYNTGKEASIKNNIPVKRLYLSSRVNRRIGSYVYTSDRSYEGTIYNHSKGKNKTIFEGGYSVPQVCDLIGKSKFKVYELLNYGDLEGYKTNKGWCIKEESVLKYIKER